MKITYLFEPPRPEAKCALTQIATLWWQGLIESGHSIQVLTTRGTAPPVSKHPHLNWAEAVSSWSWLESGKIFYLLLNQKPDVIHLILSSRFYSWDFWPSLKAFDAFKVPVVVSTADGLRLPAIWPRQFRRIGPDPSSALMTPSFAQHLSKQPANDYPSHAIPGTFESHRDWRLTLSTLMEELSKHPSTALDLGWSWSEVPLRERLAWREKWERAMNHHQLRYQEPRPPFEKIWTEFLKPKTWVSLGWTSTVSLDEAINNLARTYRSMVQSNHVSFAPPAP